MKQLKVGLPDDLRSKLDAAAEAGGKGLAEEVRERLEFTLADDSRIRELIEMVREATETVDNNLGGRWFDGNHAIEILAETIKDLVLSYRSSGQPSQAVHDIFGDPVAIGQTLAREVRRKGNFPHMQEAAAKRRGHKMTSRYARKKEG